MTEAADKTIVDDSFAPSESELVTAEASGPPILAARYELLGLLGSGGMGTVYRARDCELDEIVALKVLKKELAQAPGMLERFRREVKLARKVTHVNVARTFDIGEHAGDRFLTMELIDGEPLSVLSARGLMPLGRVLAITREILEGLAASHDAGVVHGDLKPENVLCTRGGRIVITDFGISRALTSEPGKEQTGSGLIVGTPQYMAPEQVDAVRDLDGRADLYALGCMLYRLLTGEAAWSGSSYVTVAAARLIREPPDPGALRPDLAPEVRAFVLKCMARDRNERFPKARAAIEALAHAMANATQTQTQNALPALTGPLARAPLKEVATPPRTTRTVAVLPVQNQGAPDDAYLAAGLTDDLIDVLSAVTQLRVRPRGAVAPFDRPGRDAREAGRALGVDAVVEGTLRRAGETLRVTLRLVTVADGFQLWAQRFDRPASDFFAVGDAAAAEVAAVLTSEKVTPPREGPTDAAALDLYLRGRFIFTRSYFDVAEAVALLRAAHDRAPNDGRIAAAYALALMRHQHIALLQEVVVEQAREIAARVISDDPSIAEAHVALAMVHLARTEPSSAVVALARALEIAPHAVDALAWMGNVLLECDRVEEAMEYFDRVVAEDPEITVVYGNITRAHALLRDWDAVATILESIGGARGERGDSLFFWLLRTRFALWRGDTAHAGVALREIEDAAISMPMKDRLRAMLSVARDGILSTKGRELLNTELSHVNAPRRSAFNAQVRIEIFARARLFDDALKNYQVLEETSFIDLAWLDRCAALDDLRAHPIHQALRASTHQRVERILGSLDATSSGLRRRR